MPRKKTAVELATAAAAALAEELVRYLAELFRKRRNQT